MEVQFCIGRGMDGKSDNVWPESWRISSMRYNLKSKMSSADIDVLPSSHNLCSTSSQICLWNSNQSWFGSDGVQKRWRVVKRWRSWTPVCISAASRRQILHSPSSSSSPCFKHASWKVSQMTPSMVFKSSNDLGPLATIRSVALDHEQERYLIQVIKW